MEISENSRRNIWSNGKRSQQFPDFLKLFPGNFRTICPRFENFGIYGRMVSAQVHTWLLGLVCQPLSRISNPYS